MKRIFGTWFTRFWENGQLLTEGEHHLLTLLVSELPPELRAAVEAQFDSYNLAQREIDRRTLNFYRVDRRGVQPVTPLLNSKPDVAPLVRLTVRAGAGGGPLHAVLTAVNGRAFSVSFSKPVPEGVPVDAFVVEKVTQAWTSNIDVHSCVR